MSERLAIEWNGLDLVGTLHTPSGDAPYAAVLMMQGSGESDRDSNGYFPEIQAAFLSAGCAVYSFDKPGCGESTGKWLDYALEGRIEQASVAIDALADHPAIDAARIGVWGQSQGGWMAQMLGARRHDLAFAIANSGPTLTVPEQDRYGCRHWMAQQGHTTEEIEAALDFVRKAHAAAALDVSFEDIERDLVADARDKSWYTYATLDDADEWQATKLFVQEGYEPKKTLRQIGVPFLAVYGGEDVLLPAHESAEESAKALAEAPATDTTVVVFPGATHRILTEDDGPFVDGFLDLITDWVNRRI